MLLESRIRYLVVAPRVVVAGGVYRAVVNTLPPAPLLIVKLSLLHLNVRVAAVEHLCSPDSPQVLELKVRKEGCSLYLLVGKEGVKGGGSNTQTTTNNHLN
ncbi:hypothetical protein Pmani_039709 [Petrolisthes manimaculis]|uniref:Uncharacterized protein n=1 Tax=Petrolisthes manimaculis TaxID=1843537 RepID=A0AAE1NDK9_9EUCA|nr:hypothetical protein Pmani_039709 [Petrolisthes manimaculis]